MIYVPNILYALIFIFLESGKLPDAMDETGYLLGVPPCIFGRAEDGLLLVALFC